MEYVQSADGRKFLVDRETKYLILDSLTRNALGLRSSAFIPKSDDEINILKDGKSIEELKNARLIKSIEEPVHVFAVLTLPNSHKRHVPNPITFFALGFKWDRVEAVTKKEFEEIPTEAPLTSYEEWEKDAQDASKKNIPKSPSGKTTIRFNVFGPMIDENDIGAILASTPDVQEMKSEIDVKAHYLSMFFERPVISLSENILKRFIQASSTNTFLGIVPHTEEISERLVEPLVSAKRCYCVGEYLACVAICGTVGEMLAILIWKMSEVILKGRKILPEEEKLLFRSEFERLNQDRRLEILLAFGHITREQLEKFKIIKDRRRPYLHLWSGVTNAEKDALEVFINAMLLFKEITGIKLHDASSVEMNPILLRYLTQAKEQNPNSKEESMG